METDLIKSSSFARSFAFMDWVEYFHSTAFVFPFPSASLSRSSCLEWCDFEGLRLELASCRDELVYWELGYVVFEEFTLCLNGDEELGPL